MRGFWTAKTLKPIRFGIWATTVVALAVSFLPQSVLEGPRELYFDALTQALPAARDDRIVVIDIDRAALASLNGKPWTRAETARLATAIAAARPAAIGFDLVFSADCDPAGPVNIELAKAIGSAPTALGFLVSDRPGLSAGPSLPLVAARNATLPGGWFIDGVETACPPFLGSAQASAGTFLIGDGDARVRRVQPYAIFAGSAHATLALAAVQLAFLKTMPPVLEDRPPHLRIAAGRFDLTEDGTLRFVASKADEQAARTISAADVLSGGTPETRIAGRILFVGSSLPSFGGLRATASMPLEPSVQIHADLTRGLMAGRLPQRVSWIVRYEALYVLLAGSLLSLAAARFRPAGLVATGLAVILFTCATTVAAYGTTGLLLDGFSASVALAAILTVVTTAQYSRVREAERRARARFGQYLPKSVVDRYLEAPEAARMAGEAREVTALFTDIEGFSALARRIDPKTLVELLDTYFSEVNGLIERRGGMIDKVVGDAVHALFNAPEDLAGHVDVAIACAGEIRALTEEMRGRPAFSAVSFGRTRIGIETGPVILGEVGIGGKLDYTAHGEAVNLAARLQEANKQHQTSILIGPCAGTRSEKPLRGIGTHEIRDYGGLGLYTLD
ncbi:CHASE2 domain-containing protein [Rhizobium sp. C4]|uniref:CHASE2 domain-containing protein n=1 Tax=Rhizobium sp. C4 TaxID=1349800 RepID=UPI001E3B5C78|nr:CHASE2 domain-containing protein [Rhizobium sp. C4]MCD2175383.1 CHASE2 domain-containing protein [Rhizobium sp. C4]